MSNEKVLNEARTIIAGFLKDRRIELGMSQQILANKCEITRETINRMEAGKFWLGMKQYLIICEALHLFPCVVEMESETEITAALRKNWHPNPKSMNIEDALKKKSERYNRGEINN